ncbi:MAG TPA: cytochrome c peroxidase [Thermoanaerobaculia bacterium]
MNRKRIAAAVALIVVIGAAALTTVAATRGDRWSDEELETLRNLSLSSLEPLPPDPTNRVADDPRAVQFGQRLFFETRLSSNGKVSCATCHDPAREFQDGTPLAKGVGTTDRRTMPIAGTAYSPFLFWDGRKDSQWAQALGPLESGVEHGGSRAQYAHVIADRYRDEYERLFGALPDLNAIPRFAGPVPDPAARAAWDSMSDEQRVAVTQVYVNIGKAIAAYERRLQYGPSRFDRYVDALIANGRAPEGVLTRDEIAGLRLFIGKANCTQCHDGALFTNNEFHNTGVPAAAIVKPDHGRTNGAKDVLADEFNCRSRWSDAKGAQCSELQFMIAEGHTLERAFKVPSLRNVAERAPYMHAGQFATLDDVVAHYNRAAAAPAGHSELKPLRFNENELQQLVAFLRTLSGGTAAPADLLRNPGRTGGAAGSVQPGDIVDTEF